ncbi:NAD(P)H-binding protein [Phytoactinopolyspora mesophila]|uniref:NAD(P)H-binding protein n=1 Tax=Phytoactinopolyspora mesophila TaxID=2650750 RepID=A0A7K3M4P3_9ACTN|nr:NAD(P)H-binding protein [Phytoactinopolyspora mesophila]NDL58283.1 NAD(P)H-binding protein [Phytoactinopolyspora mesophila]
MTTPRTILVTGATGNVGRHVVSGLLTAGVQVRAMVRNPDTARLPDGVDVVPGDLAKPETLAAAADGVDAVFLLWPNFSTETAPAAIQTLAKHASRIVYLSAIGSDIDQRPDGFWGEIEQLVEEAGVEWTFLRSGGIATNTLGWADEVRAGVVRWPYGGARRSLVHEADLAAVAVLALLDDQHVGQAYALTGPELVSQADQVHIIGEAVGRTVRWEELSREEAHEQLLAEWGDPGFVQGALDAWAAMVDSPEPVTTTVERVTGKPARTFRQWAADHADDFR